MTEEGREIAAHYHRNDMRFMGGAVRENMEQLEKLKTWLLTYPGWEGQLQINCTCPEPGNTGLFPKGVTQLHRQEDILGNRFVRNRAEFTLYRVACGQADGTKEAAYMAALEAWICRQSQLGAAPRFGDIPTTELLRAEKAMLHKSQQTGTAVYQLQITAEYTCVYEAL